MSGIIVGLPCSICGKPSTSVINLDASLGLASGAQSGPVRKAPRCDDHNPYMVKCPNGHFNWIDHTYCGYCGVVLRPEPFETPVRSVQ
jgi:hypothetical protein